PEERRRDRAVREAAIGEVAEDGRLVRDLHRLRVIGLGPGGVLRGMAAGTRLGADVARDGRVAAGLRRGGQAGKQRPEVVPAEKGAGREEDEPGGASYGRSHTVRIVSREAGPGPPLSPNSERTLRARGRQSKR